MEDQYQNCRDRYNKLQSQIRHIKPWIVKRDLTKMLAVVENHLDKLSQLAIHCRRIGKDTVSYKEELDKTQEALSNVESYLLYSRFL